MLAPSWPGQIRLASGAAGVAGLWMIASPFALGFSSLPVPTTNAVVIGAIVVILSAIRFFGAYSQAWLSWITVALGLWLFISPWVLDYAGITRPTSNDVGIGIIIAALAAWSALSTAWSPRH